MNTPLPAFTLPRPLDVFNLKMSDGAEIHVRRFGCSSGPRLFFSHGNGFATDAYLPLWKLFLSDCEVIIYDQRNHGWNPLHDLDAHNEARMATDMETVFQCTSSTFGLKPAAGIFHSLSSIVSLKHWQSYGRRFQKLILLDPPLIPPHSNELQRKAIVFASGLCRWAQQRQYEFDSWTELSAYFRSVRRMSRWVEGAADLMAQSITALNARGKYQLICPPAYEAKNYGDNLTPSDWSQLADAGEFLTILAGDTSLADADPPCRVCRCLGEETGIRVLEIPMTGHMLHIEQPASVALSIRAELRAAGFAISLAN